MCADTPRELGVNPHLNDSPMPLTEPLLYSWYMKQMGLCLVLSSVIYRVERLSGSKKEIC